MGGSMRTQRPSFSRCAFFFAVVLAFCSLPAARAQTASVTPASQDRAPQARITQAVDEKNLVILRGNVHPLARAEYDQGPAAEAQPLNRILLLLQRGPDQEAALRKLLQDQQDKFSPNYHAWLTPEQFGKQFGPADADLQAVTNWLSSQGFSD